MKESVVDCIFVVFHHDESTGSNILNQFMKDHKMFMNN